MWSGAIRAAAASAHKRASGDNAHHDDRPRQPYGRWESPITPEWLAGLPEIAIEDVFLDKVTGQTYYTERCCTEGGYHSVLVDLETEEPVLDSPQWIVPAGSGVAHNGNVYYSNAQDGRAYIVEPGQEPRAIAADRPGWRFADLEVHPLCPRFVVAVLEALTSGSGEPGSSLAPHGASRIVVVDTQRSSVRDLLLGDPSRGRGSSSHDSPGIWDTPRFSPDGEHLGVRLRIPSRGTSQLWVVDIGVADPEGEASLLTSNPRCIGEDDQESFTSGPSWITSDILLFTSNIDGHAAPRIYDSRNGHVRPVSQAYALETRGEAHSASGFPEAAALDSNHIVCTSTRNGRTVLSVLTLSDGARAELATPYAAAAHLRSASPGKVLFVGRTDVTPTAIVEMAVDPRDVRGTLSFAEIGTARCHRRTEIPHSAGCISTPATVELAHPGGGARLVATCYPPTHAGLAGGVPGELPPVVVRVFGNGERPPPGLDWAVQVYTTRGFACVDVTAVDGPLNLQHCYSAVELLGARGLVDPGRVVVRGGGSGSLAVFSTFGHAAGTTATSTETPLTNSCRVESRILLIRRCSGIPEAHSGRWREGTRHLVLLGEEDREAAERASALVASVTEQGGRADLRVVGSGRARAEMVREMWDNELAFLQEVL